MCTQILMRWLGYSSPNALSQMISPIVDESGELVRYREQRLDMVVSL